LKSKIFKRKEVKNLTKDKIYKTTPFPRFIRDIVYAGGLKNYIKETGDL